MAPVVLRLKQDKRFECKVCVSGQHRELLDGDLCFGGLEFSSERHEDRRAADGRIEHLDQTFLAGYVGILEIGEHLLLQVLPGDILIYEEGEDCDE